MDPPSHWTDVVAVHKAAMPRKLNQALMDFGSIICRPRNPLCLNCPLENCLEASQEESILKNLVHSRLPGVRLGSPNQQPGDEDYYYHYY